MAGTSHVTVSKLSTACVQGQPGGILYKYRSKPTMTNTNKIKTAFRTTGRLTGNFGKNKVRAGATLNNIGNGEVGCLPTFTEHLDRLLTAYPQLNDRQRATLLPEMKRLAAKLDRIADLNAVIA